MLTSVLKHHRRHYENNAGSLLLRDKLACVCVWSRETSEDPIVSRTSCCVVSVQPNTYVACSRNGYILSLSAPSKMQDTYWLHITWWSFKELDLLLLLDSDITTRIYDYMVLGLSLSNSPRRFLTNISILYLQNNQCHRERVEAPIKKSFRTSEQGRTGWSLYTQSFNHKDCPSGAEWLWLGRKV